MWGFGGLAISDQDNYRRHWFTEVADCAAGPAAGLALALLTAAIAAAAGGSSHFTFSRIAIPLWHVIIPSPHIAFVVNNLLYVNFFWSLLNLLPVFPLDGGQITRAILEQRDPAAGGTLALKISIGVAVFFGGLAVLAGHMNTAFLFGFCAVSSLQAVQDRGQVGRRY